MIVRAWCVPGAHPGPECGQTPGPRPVLPEGWQVQRASIMALDGEHVWYADSSSKMFVLTCAEHCLAPDLHSSIPDQRRTG